MFKRGFYTLVLSISSQTQLEGAQNQTAVILFCPALHMFSSAKGFFEFLVGGFSPPLIIQFLFLKKFIVKPPARCCWVHPQLRALNT